MLKALGKRKLQKNENQKGGEQKITGNSDNFQKQGRVGKPSCFLDALLPDVKTR